MNKLTIEYLPLEDLKPYANNAKIHTEEQIQQIRKSIEEFGMNDPIAIWKDNEIIEGHGRLLACQQMGMKEVPVIRLDDLTDEQRRAYMNVHNHLTMNTGFDMEKLAEELGKIENIDMGLFGFDMADMMPEKEIIEDDYQDAAKAPARVQAGQVWVLGNHRLMCGDSSSKADADKLFGGGLADCVFTDPPYGVSIGDKNKALQSVQKAGRITENIENDTLNEADLYDLLKRCMSNLREHCKPDCSYYVTAPQGGSLGMMMMMMRDAGLEVRHNLVWVKNSATFSLGRLDYNYRHEPIFYTWTKNHHFYGNYDTTVIDDTTDIDKMTKSELKDLIRILRGEQENSVIYADKPLKADLHPTMKPVKLVAHLIANNTQAGDVVADFFGGSGTTIIACEQLGLHCRMMELDPHYCDVIIDRWEQFTGGKAVLLED